MALVPFPSKGAKPARNEDQEPDWDDHDLEPDAGGKMSFLDHLDELRRRIIYSLIGVGLGFVLAFVYVNELFEFVLRPMQEMLPPGQTLIYTDPAEAFFLKIKLALMAGLILAAPVVFSQVWLFVAPGLYAHEKKLAIPFVVMSTFFFAAGAAFSHYVVFPIVWQFFADQATDFVVMMPRVETSYSMYLRLILALGLTFELPTVVLFLARMGMITPRFMIRNFKYAVLIIIAAAAVLSPDGGGVGMIAMGGPVILLYIFSIGLAWIFGKKRRAPEPESA
jgi:sec-independent protein translocase protein TatC